MTVPFLEDNDQTQARRAHLEALRQLVGNVYPNKFERSNVTENPSGEDTITSVVDTFKKYEPQVSEGQKPSPEDLETANTQLNKIRVRVAGRIAAPPRVMGKAAFVHLSDGTSRLQIYVRRQDITGVRNDADGGEVDGWELFNLLDHGDFIGVEGYLFVTRTGELSVHVEKLQFLAKALLPMPDKMHGISDPEIRRRQRYVDLIAGSLKVRVEEEEEEEEDEDEERVKPEHLTPRQVFERRSRVISAIRHFLDKHKFVEVETPMLTPLATGAAAKPFETYHSALGIPLYARIAPELYLKRLVVGGFERVYELNRNFRNEGISAKHNPEFTMLEFYMAYADVNQMMDFAEKLLRSVVQKTRNSLEIVYDQNVSYIIGGFFQEVFEIQGDKLSHSIDFSPKFRRLSMKDAIAQYLPDEFKRIEFRGEQYDEAWLDDPLLLALLVELVRGVNKKFQILPSAILTAELRERVKLLLMITESWSEIIERDKSTPISVDDDPSSSSRHLEELFGLVAERELIQPTFITDFPKPISPLSKASPSDPSIAERFEYFVGGLESGNGFSELNDPEEQYQRFNEQVQQRERGDEEAMVMDEDYIRALSYGMPPAAGIGIGIDRLVMLLANKQSIRDVIMFPHMRPERHADDEGEAGQ